jgi:phenylpropionate dioxygenase-like ring-hydroxylating dioxygenase large terminal subunit
MIPDMWYAVLDANEVKGGKPRGFRRLGDDLVFWRDGNQQVVAMRDRCPHRSAKLSLGKIVDGNIQCPFHGFRYGRDGAVTLIPANGKNGPKSTIFRCETLVSREAHGLIWVWNGEPRDEYPPIPWFDNLSGFTYSTFQAHWDCDHTRAIEGMLDVSHLPFVHSKTIGRGNQTLVNGPYTTLDSDRIRVWISNQPDAGLPAVKPTELPAPDNPPSLYFNFPNVWQIRLGEKLRIVNISAPVDDEHVVIYSRTYQNVTRIPLLGRALTSVSNLFNRYTLSEDYAISRSQRPKKSDLNIGEHFIPADRPIALYLQHRRNLRASNSR